MSSGIQTFQLRVPVNNDLTPAECIAQGAPDRQPEDFILEPIPRDRERDGDQFLTDEQGIVWLDLRLVQHGANYRVRGAVLEYLKTEKVTPANLRVVLAVTASRSTIAGELKEEHIYLHSSLIFPIYNGDDFANDHRVGCYSWGRREVYSALHRNGYRANDWFLYRETLV